MMERAVFGNALVGNDRPSRRYRSGRTCAEPGCRTVLSMYNDGRHCALHQPMVVPRTRGRKIA